MATNLFVRVDQENRRYRERISADDGQCLNREQTLHEPGFHVVRARSPKGSFVIGSGGHRGESAHGPDRVAVAQDQLMRPVASSISRHGEKHAPAVSAAQQTGLEPTFGERVREQREDFFLRFSITRRRLAEHESFEKLEHCGSALVQMFEDSLRQVCGHRGSTSA